MAFTRRVGTREQQIKRDISWISMSLIHMDLFDNGDPEELLFLVRNFNINLVAPGTLEMGAKNQYLLTLLLGEALCQFDLLSTDMIGAYALNVEAIILELSFYFTPVNLRSKQNRAMRRGMRKPHSL